MEEYSLPTLTKESCTSDSSIDAMDNFDDKGSQDNNFLFLSNVGPMKPHFDSIEDKTSLVELAIIAFDEVGV